MGRERIIGAVILGALGVALGVRADQPIVENYVGRQIPTAMVAWNLLDRGTGFLHPTLHTAPFPNRFLVEPPVYAQVVALVVSRAWLVRRQMGWPADDALWERSGRLVSATMMVLGAWAFWGIARRREGSVVALVALGSFGCLPVVLKFGRAFQPDAFMVGCVWLGLRAWDEYAAVGRARWAWVGGFVLTLGLMTKVTAAWVLIPWFVLLRCWSPTLRMAVGAAMLWPALMWYLIASSHLRLGGSHASADNAAIWVRSLSPLGWLRSATWEAVGGNLLIRAFTPVGFVLMLAGWCAASRSRSVDRFWAASGVGFVLAIVALGPKWHHTYYWLIAAPLASVGIARALVGSFGWGRRVTAWWRAHSGWCRPDESSGRVWAARVGVLASFCCAVPFVACAAWQVRATWSEPPEWVGIREAGARLAALVDPRKHQLLVAPEALLYYADRRGIRLDFGPEATVRAAGEWGRVVTPGDAKRNPLALVDALDGADPGPPDFDFNAPPRSPFSGRLDLNEFRTGPVPPAVSKANEVWVGVVADVGRITRRGEPREVFRAEVRRLAQSSQRRPGLRILIDEPALFVFEPGRPTP